jgi:hypothetical protein
MPALGQIRHERFCQLYARLGNASEAYRQAGYQGKNADVLSAQLLVDPSICKRIREICEDQKMRDNQGPTSAVPRFHHFGRAGRREFQQSALRGRHDEGWPDGSVS